MARILAIGNATLDIINIVERYPHEDQEVRAMSQQRRRGGNSANTLVVLSQLGHDCAWAGTLADEPDAALIRSDLEAHGIDLSAVHTTPHGKVPTSYVTLSRDNGSRTIVHFRDLPEYHTDEFANIDLGLFDWIHLEGRNLDEIEKMLARICHERPDLHCSLEVEKPRANIEKLFHQIDLIMFSREYAQHQGFDSAEPFLEKMKRIGLSAEMSCTWGEKGAHALTREGSIIHVPAFPPPAVVDTLGAGDVFNAGLIDQLARGNNMETALIEASRLAGKKCGRYGLNNLIE